MHVSKKILNTCSFYDFSVFTFKSLYEHITYTKIIKYLITYVEYTIYSHIGHCTHTSESANVKEQKSQRRN